MGIEWPNSLSIFAPKVAEAYGGLGLAMAPGLAGGVVSGTWPVSNLAIYVPFRTPTPILIARLLVINGSAVSGNIDVGVYSHDGTRLVSIGSTAHATINALQSFDITDTIVGPGLFYLGVAMDNTTGALSRSAISAPLGRAAGLAQQASAFPLPATATFATYAQAYYPFVGFSLRGSPL